MKENLLQPPSGLRVSEIFVTPQKEMSQGVIFVGLVFVLIVR